MCGKQIGHFLQNDAKFDQNILCGYEHFHKLITDGRTHTAIIVHTCGSCNTVLTLNTCYTGTVESIGGYILEQSVSVRVVPEYN